MSENHKISHLQRPAMYLQRQSPSGITQILIDKLIRKYSFRSE